MGSTASERHPFFEGFAALEKHLAERDPSWLAGQRRAAGERFATLGFPTTRLEEWKQTSVAALAGTRFRPAERRQPAASSLPPRLASSTRLVFVDGRLDPALSTDGGSLGGARIEGLAAALSRTPKEVEPLLGAERDAAAPAFRALNGALFEDGAFVHVPDGVTLDEPIELLHVATGEAGEAIHPRNVVVVGARGRLRLIESYVGLSDGAYLTNGVSELILGDGARLEHCRLELEGPGAFHISAVHSRQGRDSHYHAHAIQLGARLARHDVTAVLDGQGATCRLDGLVLSHGEQHFDNHTLIDHAAPHCDSRELYKTILTGRSRTVFNGRIVVRPGAQRTDAKQSNPNLLLSDGALAHTRPQLEIYADDVKCTHGATIGRLDEASIFYLRSRGLPHAEARQLLVAAFAGEVLETLEHVPLREAVERRVTERLLAERG